MTAGVRRGSRRRESNSLSHRLAAIRRHGSTHLGTVEAYLLGKNRFREVVAVALFLISCMARWFCERMTIKNLKLCEGRV